MTTDSNRALRQNAGACRTDLVTLTMPTITSPDDVIVRILYVGICGTDLHILSGRFPNAPEDLILGHEVTGVVDTIGSDVTSVSVGSHVVVNPVPSCGKCQYCRQGKAGQCLQGSIARENGIFTDGGWRDYWKVDVRQVELLPVGLPVMAGVLVEPLACVCQGWQRNGPLEADSRVLLQGAGIIGLLWASLFDMRGYSNVTISEINTNRQALAKRLIPGYTVLNATELQGKSNMFDLVVDCTGSTKAMEAAMTLLRKGGRLNIFGCSGAEDTVSFKPIDFLLKDMSIVTTLIDPYSVPKAIPVLQDLYQRGYLDFGKLGIKVFSMEDNGHAIKDLQGGLVTKSVLQMVKNS